jgi:hypothetical protein
MQRFVKILLSAGFLTAGIGVQHALAEEQEKNNVSWELQNNYNDTHQTTCTAENYNEFAVDAVFEVFPAAYDDNGVPMAVRTLVTMQPYTEYQVYNWPENVAGPGPHCALRSYSVRTP